MWEDGKPRASLALNPAGGPALTFVDSDEKTREMLGLGNEGDPNIVLLDKQAKIVWSAP
jgi:hypothetical protein